MSAIYDISGTTNDSFTINGKVTLLQGSSTPDEILGVNGDVYFQSGVGATVWVKKNDIWVDTASTSLPNPHNHDNQFLMALNDGYTFADIAYKTDEITGDTFVVGGVYKDVRPDKSGALAFAEMDTEDFFKIRVGSDVNGDGWAELLTGSNANEPIYFSQYGTTVEGDIELAHQLTILDKEGYTQLALMPSASNSFTSLQAPTIGWVNNPELSTNVVHRSGQETIEGTKTFENQDLFIKSDTIDRVNGLDTTTQNEYLHLAFKDKNDKELSHLKTLVKNGKITTDIGVVYDTENNNAYKGISVIYDSSTNDVTTEALTPKNSASMDSKQIATVGWVNDYNGSTNVVHRSGQETINGKKTFSDTIISSKVTSKYILGNQGNAIINSTADAGSYTMLAKMNSTNGYFTTGTFLKEFRLQYTSKETVLANVNRVDKSVTLLNEDGETFLAQVPASSSDLNSTQAPTIGWVNDPTKSTNVVHRSNNENISGVKSFSDYIGRNTTIDQKISNASSEFSALVVRDVDNKGIALYNVSRNNTNNMNRVRVLNNNASTSNNWYDLRVVANDGGYGYLITECGDNLTNNSLSLVTNDTNSHVVPTMGWVNNPNTSTNVVHRTGNETIAGTKTLTSNLLMMRGSVVKGTAPSANKDHVFAFYESEGSANANRLGQFYCRYSTNGVIATAMSAFKPVAGNTSTANIIVYNPPEGSAYTYAPSTQNKTEENQSTYYNNQIVTAKWFDTRLTTEVNTLNTTISTNDSKVVHLAGTETITGKKTFNADMVTSKITPVGNNTYDIGAANTKYRTVYATTFNGTATSANWADIAEYYDGDNDYPEGTLMTFGGDKEVTIAIESCNAVISSRPGVVLNSESGFEHPCLLSLAGRVPVRVIGKVNKFDYIQLSEIPGVAKTISINDFNFTNIIARALESKETEEEGLVLCVVKFEL